MFPYLLVALGSALGGVARYALSLAIDSRFAATGAEFPWGTLAVNVCGSLLIGLLAALGVRADKPWVWQLLAIGVLGGFTTFSAFSLQLFELVKAERWALGAGYLMASVAVCLLGTGLGWALGLGIGSGVHR